VTASGRTGQCTKVSSLHRFALNTGSGNGGGVTA
jgi:hypothetical protein